MPPHQLMAKLEGQLPAAQKARSPCVAVGVAVGVGLAAIAIELHWNKNLNTRFVMDFFALKDSFEWMCGYLIAYKHLDEVGSVTATSPKCHESLWGFFVTFVTS